MASVSYNDRHWLHQHQSIQDVDSFQAENEMQLLPEIRRLEITIKVMRIACAVLLLLASVAMFYLPVWVPLGVCFPLSFLLDVSSRKLQERVEAKQKLMDSTLLARGLLSENGLQGLRPLGEWNLPTFDPRLRSDWMMREELKKSRPEPAARIERLVGTLDLEITPKLKSPVAAQLAQVPDRTEDWNRVRALVCEAKEHLLNSNFEKYEKCLSEAKELALLQGGTEGLSSAAFKGQTDLIKAQAFKKHVKRFQFLHSELIALHDQLGSEATVDGWTQYMAGVHRLQHFIPGMADSVRWVALLSEQAYVLKGRLQARLDQLPQNRMTAFEQEIDDYHHSILSQPLIEELEAWLDAHPHNQDRPTGRIAKQLPTGIRLWLEENEDLWGDSAYEIYTYAIEMNNHLADAQARLLELTEDNVETFDVEVMQQLRKKIKLTSSAPFYKQIWNDLTSTSFHPPDRPTTPEERTIHASLMKIDRQMVWINRSRRYGLEWGLFAGFLIIEAIFWSNPWVVWGGAILTLLTKGGSYYVDYRLRQMDKQKQGYKMHQVLLNHPVISRVPGNRPGLQHLQQVQARYDLSGVTRTWSRVLTEGDAALPDLRPEAFAIREIAYEGSELARPVCKKELIRLLSLPERTAEQEERVAGLRRTLFPPRRSASDRQEPTESEKRDVLARRRQRLERAIETEKDNWRWTELVMEKVKKAEQQKRIIEQRLESQVEDTLQSHQYVFIQQISHLDAAIESDTERTETGDVDQILESQNRTQLERLKHFPVEVLVEHKRVLRIKLNTQLKATEKMISLLDQAMIGRQERAEEGDLDRVIADPGQWGRLGHFPVPALAAKKVELLNTLEALKKIHLQLIFCDQRAQLGPEKIQMDFSFVLMMLEFECETLKGTIPLLTDGERKTALLKELTDKQKKVQDIKAQHYKYLQALKILQKDPMAALKEEQRGYENNLVQHAQSMAQIQLAIDLYTCSLLLESIQGAIVEREAGRGTVALTEKISQWVKQLIESTPDNEMRARLRASHVMTWEAFKTEITRDQAQIEQYKQRIS
ncbi:MAG: hypothetical protein S4CHLAM2_00420 [Chlamydiales bacterium]|nr:hypothetical protein [Chlamydiales bacterium]